MSTKPALLLLPNLLSNELQAEMFLPSSVFKAVSSIDGLIAESEIGGRRYLSRFETKKAVRDMPIALFNEHTQVGDVDFFLQPIVEGQRWGLISDAGLPCIADPGCVLVARAKQRGITVQAFVGPSALMMAIMLSGLPAQKFFFQGYLAKEKDKRRTQIKQLSIQSQKEKALQVFIEAPYRNMWLFEDLIAVLSDDCMVCVAWDLTLPSQGVMTQRVDQWKKVTPPNLEKKPTVFMLYQPFSDKIIK